MVDLEKMNGKYVPFNPMGQLSKTASRFANDLLELSELQARLAKADVEEILNRSIGSIVGIAVGTSLLLASLPVMLFGLASAIAWYYEIEPWAAQIILGAVLAMISILTITIWTRRLLRLKTAFQRSGSELKKNMEWVKSIIRSRQ